MRGNWFITKKAGILSKIVVVVLLVYIIYMMVLMQGRIAGANEEVASLTQQLETQTQQNAQLRDAIVNSDDVEQKKDIARERLGLLSPGEKVFNFTE